MVMYKAEIGDKAPVSFRGQKAIQLETVVYSYDKDVHELTLPICTVDNTQFFKDLSEAFYLMVVVINGSKVQVQGSVRIDGENAIVTIPERLHGYSGRVEMSLYAKMTTGQQLDVMRYKFKMETSLIDQQLDELEAFYYEKFEDMIEEFKKQLQEIIDGIELNVDEQLQAIKDKIDTVETEINLKLSELQSKTDVMEDDINTLRTELSALETKLGTLQSQYNTLQAEYIRLNDEQVRLSSEVSVLTNQVDDLEARVTQIESDLNALLEDYYTKSEVNVLLSEKVSNDTFVNVLNGGYVSKTFTKDFNDKVSGSLVENPNIARYFASKTILAPTANMTEFPQNGYNYLKAPDGQRYSNLNTIEGNVMQVVLDWDIVAMVERDFPNYFNVMGATTLFKKVEVLRKDISSIVTRTFAYGNGGGGYKLTSAIWYNNAWAWANVNNSDTYKETKWTFTNPSYIALAIGDDGKVHVNMYANPTGSGVNSQFYLDYADIEYTLRSMVPVGQKVPVTMDDGRAKATISSDLVGSFLSLGAGVHSVICMPAVMNGMTTQAVRGVLTLNTATYGSFTGIDDSGRVFYINMNASILSPWRCLNAPVTTSVPTYITGFQNVTGFPVSMRAITESDGRKRVFLEGRLQPTTGSFTSNFNGNVATIPTDFRPQTTKVMAGVPNVTSNSVVGVVVEVGGNLRITIRGNDVTTVSLDGVSYLV